MAYIIGAGAILETGERGSITPAMLHATVDAGLAAQTRIAAIDFEASSPTSLRRLLLVVAGWNAAEFTAQVGEPIRVRRECTLTQVLSIVAVAAGAVKVDFFAHWIPDEATYSSLGAAGIELVAHPLEAIESAAVVSDQCHRRWRVA